MVDDQKIAKTTHPFCKNHPATGHCLDLTTDGGADEQTAPGATFFCRLPKTCPDVLATAPVAEMITLLFPVEMTPEVSVSEPFTVAFTLPLRVSPVELFSVRLLKMVAFEPARFWLKSLC